MQALVFLACYVAVSWAGCEMPQPQTATGRAGPYVGLTLVLAALPSAATAVFFFCSDALGFQGPDFGVISAASLAAVYAGTYWSDAPALASRVAATQTLASLCQLVLVSRLVLGYDYALVFFPTVLAGFAGSVLTTRFMVDSGDKVADLTALSTLLSGLGFAVSTALTQALAINHDEYTNLMPLALFCALAALVLVPYGAKVDYDALNLLDDLGDELAKRGPADDEHVDDAADGELGEREA